MSGIRTLAGDTMVYGLSTILTRMLNYLMVPYLTRVMTEETYGAVTDLYSLIPFALALLTMGLQSGWFRFAGKAADETEKNRIFTSLWTAMIAAAALFGGLVLLLARPISEALNYGGQPGLISLMAGLVALDVVTELPFARLREQRRQMRYVFVRLTSVVVNLALCLFFLSVQGRTGAEWVLAANLAASALALVMLVPSVCGIAWVLDREILRRVMIFSLPLLVSGVAGTAGEFIDRQMIKWLMPSDVAMEALGVYGATSKLAVIMILFTQMYRLAAEPFFLARFRGEDFARQSAEAMKYYVVVAVAIFLGIVLFEDVALLILCERFRGAGRLIPLLLVANALAGVVFNLSLWYKRAERTWVAIAVTFTGLAVAVALNLVLVPRMGYEGAAWARLGCEGAMVAVSLWLNRKFCPTPYDFRRMGLYVLLGGALWAAGLWTAELPRWPMWGLNAAMLVGFAAFAVWKEKLLKYIKI